MCVLGKWGTGQGPEGNAVHLLLSFCCEPKTAVKNNLFFFFLKEGQMSGSATLCSHLCSPFEGSCPVLCVSASLHWPVDRGTQ